VHTALLTTHSTYPHFNKIPIYKLRSATDFSLLFVRYRTDVLLLKHSTAVFSLWCPDIAIVVNTGYITNK
jgi:hypothetical protein